MHFFEFLSILRFQRCIYLLPFCSRDLYLLATYLLGYIINQLSKHDRNFQSIMITIIICYLDILSWEKD